MWITDCFGNFPPLEGLRGMPSPATAVQGFVSLTCLTRRQSGHRGDRACHVPCAAVDHQARAPQGVSRDPAWEEPLATSSKEHAGASVLSDPHFLGTAGRAPGVRCPSTCSATSVPCAAGTDPCCSVCDSPGPSLLWAVTFPTLQTWNAVPAPAPLPTGGHPGATAEYTLHCDAQGLPMRCPRGSLPQPSAACLSGHCTGRRKCPRQVGHGGSRL